MSEVATSETFYPGLRVEWTENDFAQRALYVRRLDEPDENGNVHEVVRERYGLRRFAEGALRKSPAPSEFEPIREINAKELEMQRWAADGIFRSEFSDGVQKGLAHTVIVLCNEVEKLQRTSTTSVNSDDADEKRV